MERYHREDVLRILRITARQLAGWERGGLFPVKDLYSFFDLLQIKKLRDLRAKRVRPAMIRDSLRAMQQQVAGMENPLLEAGTFTTRSRVVYRHRGAAVEPLAGQFVMDFTDREVVEPKMGKVHAMRAAETAAGSASRTPVYVLRTIGYSEYRTSATSAGTTPIPKSGIMNASSAMPGSVCSTPTERMKASAPLVVRSSTSPSGNAIAIAMMSDTATSSICRSVSRASDRRWSMMY